MEKKYFIQLLIKHLNAESTFEEDQLLISYYNLFENEPGDLDLLNQEMKEDIRSVIKQNAKQEFECQAE